MDIQIDYYFYSASPFTYLGHGAICAVAKKHSATLVPKPVNLFALWEISGAVPPGKRPPVRQRYRFVEIERVALFRGLPINVKPAFFPVDATLADQAIIAVAEAGGDALAFMADIFAAVWAKNLNIADEAVVADILAAHGHDGAAIIAAAKLEAVAAIRERNSADALAADAVGVPAYVAEGEVFWGQDRIDMLDHMLETGRSPIIVTEPA
ncbi:MAG: 2-hydroxychromene-2-carboxylate isomerase [Pseudomonadota bacterium]